MLVLSRKEGEEIIVGGETVITITRISSNRVAVGIKAPREVSIVRGELSPLPKVLKTPCSLATAEAGFAPESVA